MYYTLIVDDEPLMLTYLANSISAICPHFCVTGIARDGKEAMDWLARQHFDLVITDIRMPELDGLGLAKYIHEAFPQTKVIIISGYNEFEYARNAIKYCVTEYLLKPLRDNDLLDVLQTVYEQLEQQNTKNTDFSMTMAELSEVELGKFFLRSILEESPVQILTSCEMFESRGLSIQDELYQVLVLSIHETKLLLMNSHITDIISWQLKLWKLCCVFCDKNKIPTIQGRNGNVYILLHGKTKDVLKELSSQVYRNLLEEFSASHFPAILSAFSRMENDTLELPHTVSMANISLALSIKNIPAPYHYNDYMREINFLLKLNDYCEKIYQDYLQISKEQLYLDISSVFTFVQESCTTAELFLLGTYILQYICNRSNIKMHYKKAAYNSLISSGNQIISSENTTVNKLTKALFDAVFSLINPHKSTSMSESQQIAEKARQYILSHYNEQISLVEIADVIGVNSCYLSDIFHKYLGEPYSKYLLRIRMEQASRLLRENPDEKIYRIATQTGFVSPKHFISVFKKYYGMTPTTYISSIKK